MTQAQVAERKNRVCGHGGKQHMAEARNGFGKQMRLWAAP